jgi:hypothetical protein
MQSSRTLASAWQRVLVAYEQKAHVALGYSSWGDYWKAEFGTSTSYAYRLLDAGRVARAIETHLPMGESPPERVARELAPVLKEQGPAAVVEVYERAVAEHGPQPTAKQVREIARPDVHPNVARYYGLSKRHQQIERAINSMGYMAEYFSAPAQRDDPDVFAVDNATRELWREELRRVRAVCTRLLREL